MGATKEASGWRPVVVACLDAWQSARGGIDWYSSPSNHRFTRGGAVAACWVHVPEAEGSIPSPASKVYRASRQHGSAARLRISRRRRADAAVLSEGPRQAEVLGAQVRATWTGQLQDSLAGGGVE